MNRRHLLGLIGAAGFGWRWPRTARLASGLDCVVTPAQTEGPYFREDRLHRSDVRVDPSDRSTAPGVPLRLKLVVSRVSENSCAPLAGAHVDLWQCDALGIYSGVKDFNGLFDTRGKQFLRGFQLTDRNGVAEFLTIYPGWYQGRAVHIHFKVRLFEGARQTHEFTSQLYFDEALTDQVHALPPYNGKGPRDVRNERDGIFRRDQSGQALMLRLARAGDGYAGTTTIGLRV